MDLELGTAQTDIVEEKPVKLKSKLAGGTSPTNGPGGNGGGGGDDGRGDSSTETEPDRSSNKLRVAMIATLLVVMMTFAGLIAAYLVLSSNRDLEWRPFSLPIQVWISTAIILLSSIAYEIFKHRLRPNQQKQARTWLIVTAILGACFISSQMLAWLELVRMGVYVKSNPYAGFFYILTATHVLHLLGGIGGLGYLLSRTKEPTQNDAEFTSRVGVASVIGWYWHFMGILWLVLFTLLGFWK